jgi:Phage integrase family
VERSGPEVDHVHRNQVEKRSSVLAVEQGPSRRTEASPTAERGLDHSCPTSDQAQQTRSGDVQPRHRQQASGCDLVSLRVDDIAVGGRVRDRATIIQHKTARPVQFEITEQTRASLQDWLSARSADRGPYVFPSRIRDQPHVTARQYARIVRGWIEGAGMDSSAYGTHSMRRTKAARRSTARPAICERSSCFSDTRRSRAPSGISGSRSMMPLPCLSKSSSDGRRGLAGCVANVPARRRFRNAYCRP